ncbi:hypothetical protein G6O69_35190 [Pseudenhygromyxa sp. WMMC2535]|uniref:hypothetical protein n=1 Tax=Pseudenhygromyxa sp. WMMC2535 TaxID=2712867 RepID=UPI001553ACE9|nr:hypothetical protein [Pseudenhygromyxa sp. WMMC2535]NVB43122.1 hypothetical protein [Pseudenhygromyxa sp. WMMC2535]
MTELIPISPDQLATAGGLDALLGGPPQVVREPFRASPGHDLGLAELSELLADEPAVLVEPYEQFLGAERGLPQTYETTYGRFMALATTTTELPLYISEHKTPRPLLDQFVLPAAMHGPFEPARSYAFVGAAGNVAPFHFDGDGRHVMLYQLLGTKRVYLLPAESGHQLDPVFNFSGVRFHDLDHEARARFVAEAGGWWAQIGPRDGLYMGPGVWHCVDYLDFSFSINFRFGRSFPHFLQSILPSNHRLGIIMARTVGGADVDEQLDWSRRLLASFYRPYETSLARYRDLIASLDDRLDTLGASHCVHRPYATLDVEARAVAGELELRATDVAGYDHLMRVGERRFSASIELEPALLEPLHAARAVMPEGRWDRWMSFLGLPVEPERLDPCSAAMLYELTTFGIKSREPRHHRSQVGAA